MTRPTPPSERLSAALASAGAIVERVPTIRIRDPDDPGPLRRAAERFATYDWVVLTSANGVERLALALEHRTSADSAYPSVEAALASARLAVIGPATASAVRDLGGTPHVMPAVHRGEELAGALLRADPDPSGRRVLLARAAGARNALPDRLRAAGAIVDDVVAYTTGVEEASRAALAALVEERALDWITFTAGSTVRAYVDLVGPRTGGARIAAIGPVTAAAVLEAGLPEPAVAEHATSDGLTAAVIDAVAAARRSR